MTGFGERLKKLRNEKNITQSDLSEKLGVHLQTVSRWERDITEPDFSMLGLIAETLGVSLEKLLGQSEPTEVIKDKFDTIRFGKGIASLRKLFGESQDLLAGAVDVSSDTVSKWERGLICPDLQTFFNLAKHFNISLSKLYFAQVESPTVTADHADSVQIKRRKRTKLYLIICLAVFLLIAVALSVILAVCLKPQPDSGTDNPTTDNPTTDNPTTDNPTTDNPTTDNPDPKPENKCQHLYEKAVTAPTCTTQGYTSFTCSLCGYNYKGDYKTFLPHTEGDWVIDSQPTCIAEGAKHKECTVCQSTTQTQSITTIEHLYEKAVTAPTCTTQGYTSFTCSLCGYNYKDDYKTFLPHTEGNWVIDSQPTCIAEGAKHKECAYCQSTTQTQSIPTIEHNYTSAVVEPDGGQEGYTLHTCTVCGTSYQDNFFLYPTNGINYRYDNSAKTCEVTGVEKITDGRVEIPSQINGFKVTAISSRAFEDCVDLREIVIPETIKSIGMYAFHRCVLLEEVTLPDGITELEDEAFCGCRNLIKAVLPAQLTRLKYSVFSDCVNLQTVNIPSSVTVIEDLAFNNCHKLKEVTLPQGLTSIGLFAFSQCSALEEIFISKTVNFIGDHAFADCVSLTGAEFERTSGWTANGTAIDATLLEDKRKASQLLTTQYILCIWQNK